MEEIWKDIIGYEGFYQVSNLGSIRSLERSIFRSYRGNLNLKGGIKKFGGKHYNLALLSKNGSSKSFKVSRIVAIHFIPNPEKKRTVNHKDGNRKNDMVTNLEWNTDCENIQHSFRELRKKDGVFGVRFIKKYNKWIASIKRDKKAYALGWYDTEVEATLIVNRFINGDNSLVKCGKGKHRSKKYDLKFRKMAVEKLREVGCKRVSKEVGVSLNTIYIWRREFNLENKQNGK